MTQRVLTLYVGGDTSEAAAASASDDSSNAEVDGRNSSSSSSTSSSASPSYFRGGYYALERASTGRDAVALDNPDQRIAEDVASFTRASLRLLISVLRAVIDLFSFSAILYSIYPQLFVVIIVYASIGTFVTVQIGKQLVNLNYQQLRTEADFRFSLVRIRENAEAIAFYGGEDLEKSEAQSRLDAAVDNRAKVILTERNLDFFTTAYQFLIQVLPGVVVAPLYFSGRIELGVVSQSFGAFNHILNDFSIIINQFESLSQFSAGVDRLGEFADRLQLEVQDKKADKTESESPLALPETGLWLKGVQRSMESAAEELLSGQYKAPVQEPVEGIQLEINEDVTLAVDHVTLRTPDGSRTLVRDLSISLSDMSVPGEASGRGAALLVSGVSGAGKSSLLRAIAGLWTTGEGVIRRPPTGPGQTFFLPQRPYCPPGTLRDQVIYPANFDVSRHSQEEIEAVDQRITEILQTVRLGDLVQRFEGAHAGDDEESLHGLDTIREWGQILSLGEQQRISFARLLYNGAKLAILDEATSALDVDNEAVMYEALANCPSMSYVSVGHRPTLERFHDLKLRLAPDGAGSTIEDLRGVAVPVRK
uniref:ABC transporter domain-containing protein n=2 Tax=Pinguiococcus pyrenoidosus TaxID=172671 RepID=A0A7R9YA46_9STRA|mmetsp:Transcript_13595/g.50612  ORF Transcript_13595/g.50612 Transcript_13595/m.50612 type:complete len:592 (+) Transcript_13595:675-2450(+)